MRSCFLRTSGTLALTFLSMYFSNSETTSSFAARSATSSRASSFSCSPRSPETSFTELSNSGSMPKTGPSSPAFNCRAPQGRHIFLPGSNSPNCIEDREGGRPHVLDILHDGLGESHSGELLQALHAMR